MSQIALVLRVVSPMVFAHPLLVALKAWVRAGLRLVVAFSVAIGVYGLVMLVTVEMYPPEQALAGLVYGIGLAVATWLGACAGTLSARCDHQRIVAYGAAGLAMLMPIVVALHGGMSDQAQAAYAAYLLGSGVGGLAAVRLLLSIPHGHAVAT